jgi:ParB-like chromosome segregation protein Spo0J
MTTIEMTERDPRRIQPWHEVQDEAKLAALVESMATTGWRGAAVVVVERVDGDPVAVTGSHRIAAAHEAGIEVPTVSVDDLLRAEGTSLAELDEMYGNCEGDHYEAILRLDEHLPVEVIEYYGLDAH